MELDVHSLHPLEIRLLRHVSPGETITSVRLIEELNYQLGHCNQAFSWLLAKGFIEEKERITTSWYEITELGKTFQQIGTT